MTDLFSEQGINFDAQATASTHPTTTPDPITAPKINLQQPDSDINPPTSVPKAPATSNNNPMSQDQRRQAIIDVFTADADKTPAQPSALPSTGSVSPPIPTSQSQPVASPRDLFNEQGITPPPVTQVNENAFNAGATVNVAPAAAATDAPGETFAPTALSARFAKPGTKIDTPDVNAVQQYAAADDAQIMKLASTRFTPDQITQMQNNPISFLEAFTKLHANQYVPLGGLSQFYNSMDLVHIAEKVKAGEQITPDDQGKLNQFLDEQIEQKVRGFSWGGKIAYVGSQIPAFLIEYAATDGAGKTAQTATTAAVERAAESAALSKVSGVAAKIATKTALMPAQYTNAYGERRLNDISAVTDKGDMILKNGIESPATSALLAFAHTSADVAGQVAAPGIGKYIIDPATKAVSTPLVAAVNNLPAVVRDAVYQAYKVLQPNATVSKAFTAAGWAGMVEQLGANRITQILHATINYGSTDNMTMDDYLKQLTPDKDQLMVEGGLIAIAGGLHSASTVAFNLMKSRGATPAQANEAVSNMSALEKENYVNDNLPTPQSKYPILPTESISNTVVNNGQELSRAQIERFPQLSENQAVQRPATIHADIDTEPPTEQTILQGQTKVQEEANPPAVLDEQSGFNKQWNALKKNYLKPIYEELFNDVQPIEDLSNIARAAGAEIPAGERSELLTSFVKSTPEWIKRNQMVNTTTWNAEGNQIVTGKSMKSIYDDFDNMFVTTEPNIDTRHADFDKFLVAERFLEEAKNSDKTGAMVTEEQKQNSTKDISDLAQKYGDNFRFFDTFAGELREWDNRILHNLVSSGLKSQEWYDDIMSARKKYSPLQRVVDEDFGQKAITARNGLGADNAPSRIGSLKQFKGSAKEVKNTFDSRLKSSALILQKSAANQLRTSIAKYAAYYPDDVKVSDPVIVRKAVTKGYDPKLRQKLEATVEHFGASTERTDDMKARMHGSYNEMEKLIQLRLGSSEGTFTHEVGHLLDDKLELQSKLLSDPEIKGELQQLAKDRLGSDIKLDQGEDGLQFNEQIGKVSKKYSDYIQKDPEVIANMYDAYVNSPEQMEKVAPKAKAAFEKILDSDPHLAFLKDIKPSTARATEVIQRESRDMVGPKNSIPFYKNGERKYLELSPEIFKAFNNMKPIEMGMAERFIGGVFRGATKLLRFGATSYPAFILRHAYRAVETSFLNTKGSASPLAFLKHATVSIPKAMFDVFGKSDAYHEWTSSSGAFGTFMDLSDKGLAKMQKQMFAEGNIAHMLNPMRMLETMKNLGDQGPRVAVFNKAKAQGMSDLEAGLLSLEATGNYGRHGSWIKRINQYAPFFNDMMQGGDRFIRSVAKDPGAFALKALVTITIPQIAITGYYLYAADDKTREEYLNLPDWRKGVSMNIKIGDHWIALPRAFAPGFVFGALPEKIMLHLHQGYHPEVKNFWLNMLAQTATSVSPVFDWSRAVNPIIKSILESSFNYSFFKGMPIYSGDKEKTAPAMQYNQYTTETSKMLGKFFGVSPAALDNTVYDMSAKIGHYALQLSDAGINSVRKATGSPVAEHNMRDTDNPIYGGLLASRPTGTQSESYNEFREHFDDAAQAHNQSRETPGADGAAFQKDNARTLSAYPGINAANTQIHALLKQIKTINTSTNMSGDDKERVTNQLNDQITHIAEDANKSFRAATGQQ